MKDPQGAVDVTASEIGVRLFNAWRELRRGASVNALKADLYGSGDDALDPGQVDALELLLERSAWNVKDFANALYIDASSATRTVNRLVDAGLAVRQPATDDGRRIAVSATAQGRKQCNRIRKGRTALMNEFLGQFTAEEAATLTTLMERLVTTMNRSAAERARSM